MSTQLTSPPTSYPIGSCDPQNPWPGLLQYKEADRDFFRGREAETDELLRLVKRARLAVLFGLSGLGKSSLLQAGLFPRLRREENVLPVYVRLDFKGECPAFRAQVMQQLLNEAATSGIEVPSESGFFTATGATLWECFHRVDGGFWDKKNRPVTPLFVFDQFEEVFTLGRANAGAAEAIESFLDELSDLAEGRAPQAVKARLEAHPEESVQYSFSRHNYKILVTVREDFLPDLEGLRGRFADLALNRMRLRAMNGNAALTVARQAPELVDEGVAEHIVRFVAAAKPGQKLAELEADPAILSVISYELNNQRRERRETKITQELLEGSKEEVLGKFCEGAFEGLPQEVRHFVEDRLLTAGGHRDSCAQENALRCPGVTQAAIDTLVERRLIRREEQRGVTRLELAHDRLAAPIQSSREKRHEAEEIERERAAARDARARERQAVADLRRSRRQRRTLAAVAAAAMVLALAAVYETWKVRQAEKESELLAGKLLTEVIWPAPSGLTWMRRDNGDDLDQAAAARYCQNLRYGGNSDWRLPRVPELVALVRTQKKSNRREVSLSGDIWTETHLGPEEASEALVLSWNGHWTGRNVGQAGGGALCVRGSPLPGNPGSVAPLPDFAFVRIPAGNFEMGCSPGDKECTEDENPRHPVAITKPFEMNKNLVTQAAWDDVIGSGHSAEDEADLPAVNVNWFDVQVFLIVLNDRADGYHYRLPTEAEWEYAARAGTTGARYGRLGKIAWYYDISGRDLLPHPVRQKDPNPWGLYDILGDAWEWVQDWFDKDYYKHSPSADPKGAAFGQHRVIRGGSWNTHAEDVRVSKRMEGNWIVNLGFRCVREISPGGQRR